MRSLTVASSPSPTSSRSKEEPAPAIPPVPALPNGHSTILKPSKEVARKEASRKIEKPVELSSKPQHESQSATKQPEKKKEPKEPKTPKLPKVETKVETKEENIRTIKEIQIANDGVYGNVYHTRNSGLWINNEPIVAFNAQFRAIIKALNLRTTLLCVLVLHGPSSVLDENAMRTLWRCLQNVASDRAIVLTTQSVEEADALAGRIGIMSSRILALGSREELKQRVGDAYHVRLVSKSAPRMIKEEMDLMKNGFQEYFLPLP